MNLLLIINGIVTLILTVISIGNLWDNGKKRIWQKITGKGYFVVIACLIILLTNILQFNQIKKDKIKEEEEQRISESKSDSKYNFLISELRRTGYIFDSISGNITKISNNTYVLPKEIRPILRLYENAAIVKDRKDKNKYKINISCKDAGISSPDVYIATLIEDDQGKKYKYLSFNIAPHITIAKGEGLSFFMELPTDRIFSGIYVLLIGSYMNLNKTRTYTVEDLYYHNILENITTVSSSIENDNTMKLLLKSDTTVIRYSEMIRGLE